VARFYLDTISSSDQIIDLPLNIVKHMQVLRLKNGDIISLFNGKGAEYSAKLLTLDRKNAKVEVLKEIALNTNPTNKLSLAISVIANDKMDLIIQKATELGVSEIIPIYSKHSQRIANDRLANRLEHWEQIIINSCCQCRQNILPCITEPIYFNNLIENKDSFNLKVILSLAPSNHDFKSSATPPINAMLVVGPEGGFTDEEYNMALKNDYKPLKLGNLILRSETAAIAGLSLLNSQLNIW